MYAGALASWGHLHHPNLLSYRSVEKTRAASLCEAASGEFEWRATSRAASAASSAACSVCRSSRRPGRATTSSPDHTRYPSGQRGAAWRAEERASRNCIGVPLFVSVTCLEVDAVPRKFGAR
eukprot:6174198-Pleurochrysis_carterae.AAC.3